MSNFNAAFDYLMKDEGGFADNPLDSGGPTKYGITMRTLSRWRGVECTAADVKALTVDETKAIYRKWYWDDLGLEPVVDRKIATVLFDACVLFGPQTVGRRLQTALLGLGFMLRVDGDVGPQTLAAVNRADPVGVVLSLRVQLTSYVEDIIHAEPKDVVFRNGWLARIGRYKDLVA